MTRRAFTLIELIVVVAISAILLTIIAVPVIQGFNLTRAAEGLAQAQDNGRRLIVRLEEDIAQAAAVRDVNGVSGAVDVVIPDDSNTDALIRLSGAKIDLVMPAEGDPTARAGGAFINPETGKADPTLDAPKGQPNLPAAPGMSLVRYFVGLRDPLQPYNNPYIQAKTSTGADWAVFGPGADNLFVLYRAEVTPRVYRDINGDGTDELVANLEFFEEDANGDPILDDPSFFTALPGDTPAKRARLDAWKRKAVLVTELSRYDMIQPVLDLRTRELEVIGTTPRIVPLVRFQPDFVSNEPVAGQVSVAVGAETDNGQKVGASSYLTEYGAATLHGATLWPSEYPAAWGPLAASAGGVRPAWTTGDPFLRVVEDSSLGLVMEGSDNTLLFGVDNYRFLKGQQVVGSTGAYPFTDSVAPGALTSPWAERFIPFSMEERSGKVLTSFDIRDVGSDTAVPLESRVPTTAAGLANGAPGVHVGPDTAYADDVTSGALAGIDWRNWLDADVGINRRFNKLWDDWATLAPTLDKGQYCKRYLDLRIPDQPGGVPSPLDRRDTADGGSGFKRAYITPGSEVIVGPDQRPGAGYGRYVRYSRTTQRPVGPNQYYINYVDLPEPDWASLGFAGADYDPAFYDENDFISAVLQPQFRAGYVEFNSRLGEPIPDSDLTGGVTGNIYATYSFQFTEPADVTAVNYDSKSLINIVLTIRNYAQTNAPNPQSITLKGSSEVRNFLR